MTPIAIKSELLEKTCGTCEESWPADLEFFYSGGKTKDGLMSECKACYNDRRRPKAPLQSGRLTQGLQGLFSHLLQPTEQLAATCS